MVEEKWDETSAGTVLIADDNINNLKVLSNILESNGYKVRIAQDGEQVLRGLEISLVDIILLDVHMPVMDGYETCKKLKENDKFKNIPIIFVSALTETFNKVQAFEIGAADYITKPVQVDELMARVSTHIGLYNSQKKIEVQLKELKELESLRDNLLHMIIHDMRSPITAIIGNLDLLRDDLYQESESQIEKIDSCQNASEQLISMVNSLLDVYKLEEGKMELDIKPVNASRCIRRVCSDLQVQLKDYAFEIEIEDDELEVNCDEKIISRVVQNLLSNAIKFTSVGLSIKLSLEKKEHEMFVSVSDKGDGIAPEYHKAIFEKFGQVHTKKHVISASTGLGLTFCKLAVERHGGKIGVESKAGKGSVFWFTTPL